MEAIKVWVISVLVLVAPVVIRSTKLEASNVAIFYRSDFSESISYGLDKHCTLPSSYRKSINLFLPLVAAFAGTNLTMVLNEELTHDFLKHLGSKFWILENTILVSSYESNTRTFFFENKIEVLFLG
ncbi:hypothetical protein ERO13_D07G147050v2 [Gossypium hirsutum]|uniref:Uncharacterized protein n=2 Tax=Gossypium TaxID=3633 RepID=A0A5J5QT52_GOSBA|nr:hypothetical protein ES319_D07G158600v1 [Gossypium barbadense]KAG4138647.1 hypothetical protein ERO13_D07G147050v2 [Gossypium hirsutum]TYG61681.1 hypothetical protein ES288_D07G168900v1 [Gossypium darwinii]